MNPSRAPRSSVASAATGTRDPFSISFTPGSINSVRQSRPRRRSGKGSDTCTSTWGRAWSDIPTAARVVRKGAPRMTRPQTQPHEGRRCRMGLQASGRAAQVRTGAGAWRSVHDALHIAKAGRGRDACRRARDCRALYSVGRGSGPTGDQDARMVGIGRTPTPLSPMISCSDLPAPIRSAPWAVALKAVAQRRGAMHAQDWHTTS
jgi:hypothetical protein